MPQASWTRSRGVSTHATPERHSAPDGHREALPLEERRVVAVLGAGAWGTVLAQLLARNGHEARLWTRRHEHAEELRRERRNQRYLPGIELSDAIAVTSSLREALAPADAAIVAVPSGSVAEVLALSPGVPTFVSASKGFVGDDLTRLTEVIARAHPTAEVAVLSGPNLAHEIAGGLPAAATIAAEDAGVARRVQSWLTGASFRVYVSTDVAGVEACGALKNVIALAAGMVDGLALGENARAALVTRGLAELMRVGTLLGGEARTFFGLAGVGDLMATCGSTRSRNHQVGARIARGETVEQVEASGITAEGLATVRHVVAYANANGLDLPISREVERVVYERKPPSEAIRDLMTRTPREEREG